MDSHAIRYRNQPHEQIFIAFHDILSCTGVVICLIVSITFIYHTRIRYRRHHSYSTINEAGEYLVDKISFYLAISIFLFCFVVLLYSGLLRSNAIINKDHLMIGCNTILLVVYGACYGGTKLLITLLYNYRLYLIFNNSVFAYKTWFLIAFAVFTITISVVFGITSFLNFEGRTGIYYYEKSKNTLFLNNKNDLEYCGASYNSNMEFLLIFFACFYLLSKFWLCWLFVYKLHKLNIMLFEQLLDDSNHNIINFKKQSMELQLKSTKHKFNRKQRKQREKQQKKQKQLAKRLLSVEIEEDVSDINNVNIDNIVNTKNNNNNDSKYSNTFYNNNNTTTSKTVSNTTSIDYGSDIGSDTNYTSDELDGYGSDNIIMVDQSRRSITTKSSTWNKFGFGENSKRNFRKKNKNRSKIVSINSETFGDADLNTISRILQLRKSIYKQTILVLITVLSAVISLVGASINDNIGYLWPLDLIIALVCVALSFSYSERYCWDKIVVCCVGVTCNCCGVLNNCQCCYQCNEALVLSLKWQEE